jgi:hypothetical protein
MLKRRCMTSYQKNVAIAPPLVDEVMAVVGELLIIVEEVQRK